MSVKFTVPRGTNDVLPKDSFKWEYTESVFRKVAKSYGYSEIITPIFEHVEVFDRSADDTTDIVQKEMYRFQDKKGRVFALRPEGTAPVIRSYIENNMGADGNITKLFYIGHMFRYDRPQAGRSRQFSQYGLECIGSAHPYYDAETIAVFYTYLKELGLKNFVVEINSIGCSDCSVVYNNALQVYFKDNLSKMCPDCVNRYDKNPKRLLDCKVETCKQLSKNAPSMLDYLDEKCQNHFKSVQDNLKLLNIPFVVNPKIVRGLDYYTQTAFEFINANLGSQNALGGGGRYDGLINQMGGKPTPAIGFAGGFSRLLISLEQENLYAGESASPLYYITTFGDLPSQKGIEVLNYLRNNGIYAEFDMEKTSMKSQMKSADRYKAKYTIIIGEDELAANNIAIKNMTDGVQTVLSLDKLSELLCPK